MADREEYSFTVKTLLSAARRRRHSMECGDNNTDHIVELQLVMAALNTLPVGTYYAEGWERDLVDYFNDEQKNLQCLRPEKNREKGQAVTKFIRYRNGKCLSKKEKKWIEDIKAHWSLISDDMDQLNFKRFKYALDDLLEITE